jgi:hypothetical protein
MGKLKRFKRIAIRCEKAAESYAAFVHRAWDQHALSICAHLDDCHQDSHLPWYLRAELTARRHSLFLLHRYRWEAHGGYGLGLKSLFPYLSTGGSEESSQVKGLAWIRSGCRACKTVANGSRNLRASGDRNDGKGGQSASDDFIHTTLLGFQVAEPDAR